MSLLLLHKNPPVAKRLAYTGDELLWWAVIRQSAWDISYGYEQQALDAYEFLSTTGLWMLIDQFKLSEEAAVQSIAILVRKYNVRASRPLPVASN